MKKPSKKSYLLLAVPLLALGCVGHPDDGFPTASWISAPNDHTLDPRRATADTVRDQPGAGADDIVSDAVADRRYDRFTARAGEPGLAHPKLPYDPANPANPADPYSNPTTRPQSASPSMQ